ncbi:MAG: ABC transporter permease [Chitinophagaceae bacterium]|nr:MAG: ABC transporter permease [Chitinophagaceae bacterium]
MNLLFAWRYFRAKKSTNAINIIAWVSALAIVVITASFIVVLSVFNGFEGLVKSLYSTFYTDIRIGPAKGKLMTYSAEQLAAISANKDVKNYALTVEEKALIQSGGEQLPVYLKGVDSNYSVVTEVSKNIIRGKFETGTPDEPRIVLGSGIEYALHIQSDRAIYPVTAYVFRRGVNINEVDPQQIAATENLAPSGTFFIQQELDNKYAITNLDFMRRMMGFKQNETGAIEITLLRSSRDKEVIEYLRTHFGKEYLVETRFEQNRSLYSVMTLEKWAIYGILTLMLIVATFTLVGALTMLVLEKQKDIQVLKAMGATNRRIQTIFFQEGLLLAGIGAAAGFILAIIICWAQVTFKIVPIEGGSFLIDYYPVTLKAADFLLVLVTVLLVAGIAAWFPSRKAAAQTIELKS